jgi:hypothetical protein
MDGVEVREDHSRWATILVEHAESQDWKGAWEYIERQAWGPEDKAAVWSLLPSATRSALKKHQPT